MSSCWTVFILSLVLLAVLTPSSTSAAYNETLAEQLSLFASAAYAEDVSSCLPSLNLDPAAQWQPVRQVTLKCSFLPGNLCRFVVFRSVPQRRLVVAFRGTVNSAQLLGESVSLPLVPFDNLGFAHPYWSRAFRALWPQLSIILAQTAASRYETIFVGHSLGGALAALAAVKTAATKQRASQDIVLYTYGEPRVGDPKLASNINRLVPKSFRVINGTDPVPHIPPCSTIFDILGCIPLPLSFFHHNTEVWYSPAQHNNPPSHQFTVIPEAESTSGADSLLPIEFDLNYHLFYFGHHMAYTCGEFPFIAA